jgi:Cu(I)/Ag(I) efflux system membrane fusion protein/cobalt-zinc-cadmium efflux system membrane fusion protein
MILAAALSVTACGGEAPPSDTGGAAEQAAHQQLYSCGMHPQVIHEEPGSCPICGMDLTPISDDGSPGAGGEPDGRASPGVVVDPVVVQSMGVRVEPARRQTVFRHVRTIGEVQAAEDQISVVNLRFSGWVERIHVDRTGDPVAEGQSLFEIYSPDLVAAQEEYLLAVRSQGPNSGLARSARRKFELWDIAPRDIERITSTRSVHRTVPVRAPRAGFVLQRNVVEGARVTAGADLYRIGDLTQIWVTAEIYEFDAPWVEVGQQAQMELSHEGGRVLDGRVAYVYPTLNEVSRTLTIRLEFDNPDIRLKPGMFTTVYIQYRRRDDVLAVPTEAIIDSGRRKIVFVSVDDGRFEPREIVTGLTGDRHMTEVLSGIEAGEQIVTSGQFLLDSESQLQEAIRKMLARSGEAGEERP